MLQIIEVWEVLGATALDVRIGCARVYLDPAAAESAVQDYNAHYSTLGIPPSQKSVMRRFAIQDPSGKVLITTPAVIASPT
jgi:hypothetical protein